MGTPDEFIVEGEMCPSCKETPIRRLQTKVIPYGYMDEIRFGDEIPSRRRGDDLFLDIRDGKVLCWNGCSVCHADFQYYAIIKNNRWVGLELASVSIRRQSMTRADWTRVDCRYPLVIQ